MDVPPELAGVTSLGAPVSSHPARDGRYTGVLVVGFVGAGNVLLGVVLAIFVAGPALVMAAIGAFMLALALYNVVRLRSAPRHVVIYEHGFAAVVGSSASVWPWSDITSVTTKERWGRGKRSVYHERKYDVAKASGEALTLLDDVFENVQRIAGTIRDHSTARTLPQLQAAYDAGQRLTFGAVAASRAGIELDGRAIPWSDVANAVVRSGRLIITTQSGSAHRVSVWKIPNVELLGALIGIAPAKMDLVYS